MTIRQISAIQADILSLETEAPSPLPLPAIGFVLINPLVMPANWGVTISLTTRWQTDVTKSIQQNITESTSLQTRPSRRLKATVAGMTKQESLAIQQSALGFLGTYGCPVPLYCDAATVSGFAPVEALVGRVYADVDNKRFFREGRVVIMRDRPNPLQSSNDVIYAIVKEVSPQQLKLQFDARGYREPVAGDLIFPCIDAEFLESAKGTLLTDSVSEMEFEWNEIDGPNSLPALWPAISATNADVLAPIAQIIDNVPVFPLDINWADGIEISLERNIDSDISGRSSIQEPKGDAFHVFSLSVMGYDRKTCWKVLRFFDSIRGRGAEFFFVHPQSPFTFVGFVSNAIVEVQAAGNTFIMLRYKKIAFIRADGSIVIRTIFFTQQVGQVFQVSFAALPDTDFVSAQPVFTAKFRSDAIEEVWDTNTVIPRINLEIEEQISTGVVFIPPSIGYTEKFPDIINNIPDCNAFLKAGAACTDGIQKPSMVWPGTGSSVRYWRGIRTYAEKQKTKRPTDFFLERFQPGNSDLIRFPNSQRNGSQPAIRDPAFFMAPMLDASIPVRDRALWGPDGWTVCIGYTKEDFSGSTGTFNKSLMRISGGVTDRLEIRYDRAGGGGQGGLFPRQILEVQINGLFFDVVFSRNIFVNETATYLTLRFDNSLGRVHAWVNGVSALTTARTVPALVPWASYTESNWFVGFNTASALTSDGLRTAWGVRGCANHVISYARPLTIEEVNELHRFVSLQYQTTYTPAVLYP